MNDRIPQNNSHGTRCSARHHDQHFLFPHPYITSPTRILSNTPHSTHHNANTQHIFYSYKGPFKRIHRSPQLPRLYLIRHESLYFVFACLLGGRAGFSRLPLTATIPLLWRWVWTQGFLRLMDGLGWPWRLIRYGLCRMNTSINAKSSFSCEYDSV